MSRQRSVVYEIASTPYAHQTAEEIFFKAKERMPSIVLATVYNNLNTLVDQHLIRRVRIPGQPDRFDGTLRPHDHAICDGCGAVVDVELPNLRNEIERQSGLNVTSYDLSAHYVCEGCNGKNVSK